MSLSCTACGLCCLSTTVWFRHLVMDFSCMWVIKRQNIFDKAETETSNHGRYATKSES